MNTSCNASCSPPNMVRNNICGNCSYFQYSYLQLPAQVCTNTCALNVTYQTYCFDSCLQISMFNQNGTCVPSCAVYKVDSCDVLGSDSCKVLVERECYV